MLGKLKLKIVYIYTIYIILGICYNSIMKTEYALNRKKIMIVQHEAGMTYQQIGNNFHISRVRAWQIISGYRSNIASTTTWQHDVRIYVLAKAYYQCQVCGNDKCNLIIHHDDKNDNNNDLSNLIAVCRPCHARLHKFIPLQVCTRCGKLYKSRLKRDGTEKNNGLCHNCYIEDKQDKRWIIMYCLICGQEFLSEVSMIKVRLQKHQNPSLYCSRQCFHVSMKKTMSEVRKNKKWTPKDTKA